MESSAIRVFIVRLFCWALSTPDPNAIYKPEEMSSLASGVPDLSQTLIEYVRKYHSATHAGDYNRQYLEPWKSNPCEFHAHPKSEFEVQCPHDLGRSLTNGWLVAPATGAQVSYFLESKTLHGDLICYIS
jgi:hypothetical protein